MTLKTELLENRIARLIVEADAERLQEAKQKAARKISKSVKIPGFRKGKAPYQIVAQFVGEGAIIEEAVDVLGPELFRSALEEAELTPYAPGELVNVEPTKEGGIAFTFTVPLVPSVDLGDYRAIRKDFTAPEFDEERIEKAIQYLRNEHAEAVPKESPAELGDKVLVDVRGILLPDENADPEAAVETPDNETIFEHDELEITLNNEDTSFELLPGFTEALLGITAEEDRVFTLPFPEDPERFDELLFGREVQFTVSCWEVFALELPELTDEFAQEVAAADNIQSVEEMREFLRKDMLTNDTTRAENEYANEIIEAIFEQATVEYPEIMLEETINDMVEEFKAELEDDGLTLQDYLSLNQLSEEKLRDDMREQADTRLRRSLVFSELAYTEQLLVSEEDIRQESKKRTLELAGGDEELAKAFSKFFNSKEMRNSIATNMVTTRVFQRLAEIGRGEDPPLGPTPEPEPEAEAPEPVEAEVPAPETETGDPAEAEAPAEEPEA